MDAAIHEHRSHALVAIDEQVASNLPAFIGRTESRARRIVLEAGLDAQQEALLQWTLPWSGGEHRPLGHLVAPFYLLVRAHGAPAHAQTSDVGAAFVLLQRFASLLDKVEDGELTGLAAELGPEVTLNAATTLLVLSLDSFYGIGLGGVASSARAHLLRMSRGQHRDLRRSLEPRSSREARLTAIDKAAEFSLLAECAAICAGRTGPDLPPYRAIGDDVALMVQIANDLRDVVGARPSDDLRNGNVNIAIAAFLETLDGDTRATWIGRLRAPASDVQEELAVAMYRSGTVAALAEASDAARRRIHRRVTLACSDSSYAAMFLAWLDDLALLFYRPGSVADCLAIDASASEGLSPVDAILFERLLASRA